MSSDAPLLWKTLRRVRLASLSGHIVWLDPGAPAVVPRELYDVALAAGCVPIGSAPDVPAAPEPVAAEPAAVAAAEEEAPLDRESLQVAIDMVMHTGNASMLTAAGAPRTSVIRDIVGFPVTAEQIASVMAEMAAGE